jgi:hypothetical protein
MDTALGIIIAILIIAIVWVCLSNKKKETLWVPVSAGGSGIGQKYMRDNLLAGVETATGGMKKKPVPAPHRKSGMKKKRGLRNLGRRRGGSRGVDPRSNPPHWIGDNVPPHAGFKAKIAQLQLKAGLTDDDLLGTWSEIVPSMAYSFRIEKSFNTYFGNLSPFNARGAMRVDLRNGTLMINSPRGSVIWGKFGVDASRRKTLVLSDLPVDNRGTMGVVVLRK